MKLHCVCMPYSFLCSWCVHAIVLPPFMWTGMRLVSSWGPCAQYCSEHGCGLRILDCYIQEEQCLGHAIFIYFLEKSCTDFHSGWTVYIPPAVSKGPPFPTLSPLFRSHFLICYSHLDQSNMESQCSFDVISLMAKNAEHFPYSRAIFTLSFKKSLFYYSKYWLGCHFFRI